MYEETGVTELTPEYSWQRICGVRNSLRLSPFCKNSSTKPVLSSSKAASIGLKRPSVYKHNKGISNVIRLVKHWQEKVFSERVKSEQCRNKPSLQKTLWKKLETPLKLTCPSLILHYCKCRMREVLIGFLWKCTDTNANEAKRSVPWAFHTICCVQFHRTQNGIG